MAGEVSFNNKKRALKPVVPDILLNQTALVKWENEAGTGLPMFFQVDPEGFYLSARCDRDKEAQYWDICHISDVRIAEASGHLKDKLLWSDKDDDEESSNVLQLVHRKDGIASLEFITLVASNSEIAKNFMTAMNTLTHNLYQSNSTFGRMIKKMRVKLTLHANGYGELPLKTIDKILSGKSSSRLESVEFSLEIAKVPIFEGTHGQGRCIHKDKLTDTIMEEMIGRVTNCKEEVQAVFLNMSCKVPNMDETKLLKFLNEIQRDPRDNEIVIEYYKTDKALSIIHDLEPKGREFGRISPVGMWRFLASEESNVIDMAQLKLSHDMTKPLSHYYINSSHNTYCTGAQINGQSSVEIYRQCLLVGCRCVELDCWINNDDIIITHGIVNGLWVCSTISFEKVLRAINDFAFVTSDYPLILSIENHVDKPHLLRRMAFLYTAIFGDKLLKEPLKGFPIEPGAQLPSPEMLKGRILLKDKIRLKKSKDGKEPHIPQATIEEEEERKSNPDSVASPDHNDVRSPSEVSSGVNMDNIDKLPSPSDSGTVSPNNERINGDGNEAINGSVGEESDKKSLASTTSILSGEELVKQKAHALVGRSGSIVINVRMSTGSASELPSPKQRRSSKTSGSDVPSITVDDASQDHATQSTSSLCEILPDDMEDWPDHVTFDNEQNWIVVDDTTLKRPPRHSKNLLAQSCPSNSMKDLDLDDSNPLMMSSGSTKSEGQTEALQLPGNLNIPRASEGMALVGGPIVELLNYCTAVKFDSFEAAENLNQSNHVSSMDEEKAMQNLLDYPIEFARYNARQFSRIYPAGKRINSSNYSPQNYWNIGCQMVALNFQTSDLAMQLNYGKFEGNLNCGYILKPPVLRNALATPFTIFERHKLENVVPSKITLKICSGLFLSERQNMVEIETFGLPADTIRKGAHKTRYQQGPHPKWENPPEEFLFEKIILPELTLLKFSVTDDRGDLIGQRVLPLTMIRSGYRFIPLRDKHSQPLLMSSLFVFIKIENYVPEIMKGIVDGLVCPSRKQSDTISPIPVKRTFSKDGTVTEVLVNTASPLEQAKKAEPHIIPMEIPPEEQIPSAVRNRSMSAIKHDDIVVRNSKKMVKFFKREEKERSKLQGGYNTRLSQMKDKHDRSLRKMKSYDSIKTAGQVFEQERDRAMSEHRWEIQQLELRLIEERFRELAHVLSVLHEEQVKTMVKMQEKEAEKYQKLIVQVYSNQISARQKDRIGEATIRHQRIEVSRKCTEKIQELKLLHAKELDTLMNSQKKLQEKLQSDKEKELSEYKKALPKNTSSTISAASIGVNSNNNNGSHSPVDQNTDFVWDF